MQQITITMLPEAEWQVARIIRFRYVGLERPCNATMVYFLPFELYGERHNRDLVERCIEEGVKAAFGEISVFKRDVIFDNVKGEIVKIYGSDRPKIQLTVRMTPAIPSNQIQKYVGKTIYAYDYNINILLDYVGNVENYNREIMITTSYPIEKESDISWGANRIETL